MDETLQDSLKQLAAALRRRGLTTPALMLVDLFTPVAFVGEQAFTALAPLLPCGPWREGARTLVLALKDDSSRALLHKLLDG